MSRKSLPDGTYFTIQEITDGFTYNGVFPLWRDWLVLEVTLSNDKGTSVWARVKVEKFICYRKKRASDKSISVDYRTLFKTKNELISFIFEHGE